jgi:hypothetical protein
MIKVSILASSSNVTNLHTDTLESIREPDDLTQQLVGDDFGRGEKAESRKLEAIVDLYAKQIRLTWADS